LKNNSILTSETRLLLPTTAGSKCFDNTTRCQIQRQKNVKPHGCLRCHSYFSCHEEKENNFLLKFCRTLKAGEVSISESLVVFPSPSSKGSHQL